MRNIIRNDLLPLPSTLFGRLPNLLKILPALHLDAAHLTLQTTPDRLHQQESFLGYKDHSVPGIQSYFIPDLLGDCQPHPGAHL